MLNEFVIAKGDEQLALEIRPELKDEHFFCRTEDTITGPRRSKKPISYTMMRNWVHNAGKFARFETNTICYSLRYRAANALDQRRTYVHIKRMQCLLITASLANVSDNMRNLMLDHKPNSTIFQQHYLNKNFSLDVYSIFRGVSAQAALVQKVVSHGGTRSKRRLAKLTSAQSAAALQASAKIKRITRELEHIPMQHPSYGKASLALKAAKRKVVREAERKMRPEWTSKQAAEDIQRMLDGVPLEKPKADPGTRPMTSAQKCMYEALDAPLICDYKAHLQRRTNAIEALISYCTIEDPLITNIMKEREQPAPDELRIPSRDDQVHLLRQSVIRSTRG